MDFAPTILTGRLTLSLPKVVDLDDFTAMLGDPRVYAALTDAAEPREQVWHRLLRYVGHWQVAGYGHWFARESVTGRFAGSVGLMDSRRTTDPDFEGTPEAAWVFAGWAQGRGFAHEAVTAMLAWADAERHPRTVCIIDPANAPSIKFAAKLGYGLVTEATYRGASTLLFERMRP